MIKKIIMSSTILASFYISDIMAKDYRCPQSDKMAIQAEWSSGDVKNGFTLHGEALGHLLSGKHTISYYKDNGVMLCTYYSEKDLLIYTREMTLGNNCKMEGGPEINCSINECTLKCPSPV